MNILEYLKTIRDKIDYINSQAQNPFTQCRKDFNPFEAAYSKTVVWLEDEEDKKII